jgi:hypothetical protein
MTESGEQNPWATPPDPAGPTAPPAAQQPPPPYGAPQPPPQPTPYGYPPAGYGYPPQRGFNGMAIASMVLGILWLYWVGSVLALVFGYIARNQIRARHERGDGMAIAGIVLGWVGVGFFLLFVLIGIAAGAGMFG